MRASCQVTIAPPALSVQMAGYLWFCTSSQIVTPSSDHTGAPEEFSRWATMSFAVLGSRASCQATMMPPAPSDTATGPLWDPPAVHTAAPVAAHFTTPEELTCCA